MRKISINEITYFLNENGIKYSYNGKENVYITEACSLNELKSKTISWIANTKYYTEEIRLELKTLDSVIIVAPFQVDDANTIVVDRPKDVIFPILNYFFYQDSTHEISEDTHILSQKIGRNVHIGTGCFIGSEVEIGDNTVLHQNVVIECPCVIGHDCEIFSGTIIGADGFGYYADSDGIHHRERHYKGVLIGDYVDIGANCCIDRGLLSNTTIGSNTKIDNLCHIAHNVLIGENCIITAGNVICGSVVIKDNVYIAPGSLILNQKVVGENSHVDMGSLVIRNVREGDRVFGFPAKRIVVPE